MEKGSLYCIFNTDPEIVFFPPSSGQSDRKGIPGDTYVNQLIVQLMNHHSGGKCTYGMSSSIIHTDFTDKRT